MPTPSPETADNGFHFKLPSTKTFLEPFTWQASSRTAKEVPYAETFQAIVPAGSVNATVQLIKSEQTSIWPTTVAEVDVTGFASDEAYYSSKDAGLGHADPANVTLATQRGARFAQQLEQAPGMSGVPVKVMKGVEEVLSPAQVESLRKVADEQGMTLKHMVSLYDAGRGDKAVRDALSFFQQDREVEVTVIEDRFIPPTYFPNQEEEPQEPEHVGVQISEPSPANEQPSGAGGHGVNLPETVTVVAAAAALSLRRNSQRRQTQTGGEQQPQQPEPVSVEQSEDVADDREFVGVA